MSHNRLAIALAAVLMAASSARPADDAQAGSPGEILGRIRVRIQQLLASSEPELYQRHLRSVLALSEDAVLKVPFAGPDQEAQTKELVGYLRVIESGLKDDDAARPAAYLAEGRRSLDVARLSRSDGTLQLYAVSLPAHWNRSKAYPLYVQLHGRWSDLPLALVASTLATHDEYRKTNEDAIILIPWLRGNGEWRLENGSEPDVWEAIDDVKTFAKLDPDRWYISGHSWGGDDVWPIVLRTPDLWAAAAILSGDPVSVPKELALVPNARYVPFYLWKGEQDPVPNRQEALEYFRASLTEVGDPPKVVIAQRTGHMYRPEDAAAVQNWLFEHVRHRPGHFSFVIDTPQHRGVWGISIPQEYPAAYLNVEPRVSFECWIEGSTVRIETSNSNRLDVDLGPQGLNISGTAKVIVNGKEMFGGPVPAKPISLTW